MKNLRYVVAVAVCVFLLSSGTVLSADSSATDHSHVAATAASENSNVQKIMWATVNGLIAFLVGRFGGQAVAFVKGVWTGVNELWKKDGQWVDPSRGVSLVIPKSCRSLISATVGEAGYYLKVKGADRHNGTAHGDLICASGHHTVGTWKMLPWQQNRNHFELHFNFGDGDSLIGVVRRAR